MTVDDPSISHKDYVDALLAQRERAANWRAAAIVGTLGALIFSIQQAVKVYAASTTNLFSLHNDLIRSGERKLAEQAVSFATKEEVAPLKESHARQQGSSVTSGKFFGYLIVAVTLAMTFGFGIANLMTREPTPVHVENSPSNPVPVEPAPKGAP